MDEEPHLIEEQIERLLTEIRKPEYDGLTEQEAYDHLHLPYTITTQRTRALPLTIQGALGALSAESKAKLAVNPNVRDLRDKILAQDLAGVSLWVALFAGGGQITTDEAAALASTIGQTENYETHETFPPRIGKAFLRMQMPNAIRRDDFAEVFQQR